MITCRWKKKLTSSGLWGTLSTQTSRADRFSCREPGFKLSNFNIVRVIVCRRLIVLTTNSNLNLLHLWQHMTWKGKKRNILQKALSHFPKLFISLKSGRNRNICSAALTYMTVCTMLQQSHLRGELNIITYLRWSLLSSSSSSSS